MAAHGLLGLNLAPELGGAGLPLLTTLLLIQAIQAVDATLGGLAHRTSTGAVGAIMEIGTDWQKQQFVGRVARGDIAIGISEPDAGSAAPR
jgi:alkylation response protein AidB-like acyl-CoA dehydrogenase